MLSIGSFGRRVMNTCEILMNPYQSLGISSEPCNLLKINLANFLQILSGCVQYLRILTIPLLNTKTLLPMAQHPVMTRPRRPQPQVTRPKRTVRIKSSLPSLPGSPSQRMQNTSWTRCQKRQNEC